MKKLTTILLLLILTAGYVFSAPRLKIYVKNVTPNELLTTSALVPDSSVTTGMKVVPKGTFVYLMAKNFGDTTSIQSQSWNFVSKPSGSTATFTTIPSLGWVKFTADLTGTYNISASITTSSGTKDTTMNVYCSTFIGVGNFDGVFGQTPNCMMCHSSMPVFQNIFNTWKVSGHAGIFKYEIDSGAAYYGTSCIKCHTTGYDHNKFAVNNGFDDMARTLGWVWSSPPHPGKWDSLKSVYPNLVNFATIGCESCHGPGSEHANGADKNKIDTSITSGKCGQCHDEPWRHNIYNQWKNARHSNGLPFEGRTLTSVQNTVASDCNRCHDGESYVYFTKGSTHYNLTTADQEMIGCASCHDPHGNTNDFSLRKVGGAPGDTLSNGYHYSVGNGTVCLDCHKSRRDNVAYCNTRVTSSTWGPHHSTQGDVLLGKNAASFGTPYISGSHRNISGACVGCHMATTTDTGTVTRDKVGGHSWNLHDAASNYDHVTGCQGCHPGVSSFSDFMAPEDYDGNGTIEPWQSEISGLIRKLRIALPPRGVDSVAWQLIAADSFNVNLRKAYFNYQLITEDRSLGLHNPFYTLSVLLASIQSTVGVDQQSTEIPSKFELSQNYPNPFNPSTKIDFSIPKNEFVSIKIYDITGREVYTLVNEKMNAGKFSTSWLAIDKAGMRVPSGVYFYRIIAGNYIESKKMVLLK